LRGAAGAGEPALLESRLHSLPLLARGKVRDNYAVGSDRMLMVATDRLSAFDVVMGEPIPGKGRLLTEMALFWFHHLAGIVPNHLTAMTRSVSSAPTSGPRSGVVRCWSSG
jgi:phosphoribosylaminoimidazole-succinocarboxamide synthase